MSSRCKPSWLVAVALACAGCGSSGTKSDAGTSDGGSCGLSSCDLATAANAQPLTAFPDGGGEFNCSYQGLIAYQPCVSEGDPTMRVTILCSDPATPIAGIDNLTVAVTDGSGNLLKDLPFSVTLTMPTMGHGSPSPPITNNGDGTYTVAAYLFMTGVWDIKFQTSADAGFTDAVTFTLCVDEDEQ